MNRSNKSPFSLTSLLNTVRVPIEARVRAILSPQSRQQSARSITILAVAGVMGCAIGLASVQVKAGQAASAERAEVARAQAELDAALEAKSRAEAAQDSAREAPPKAQKSARSEEAAALRRKLDILEQLLVRNQEENAALRRQLKTLMAQQKNTAIDGALGRDNIAKHEMLERVAQQRAATDKMQDREAQLRAAEAERAAKDASQVQKQVTEAMVKDMKQQLLLQQNRVKQADELYFNGLTTSQEVTRLKADLDAARLQLEAAQEQLRAAQAGQKLSQKEQDVAPVRVEIALQQARLQQAQANLAQVKARYDAGVSSAAELQEAKANIVGIEVTIDQLQLKLSQKGGR